MIDKLAYLFRNPRHNRIVLRKMTKSVRRYLLVESRWKKDKAAEDIGTYMESLMGSTDLRGENMVLKRWYRHALGRAPQPSWEDMSKVKGDYASLYRRGKSTPSIENHRWELPGKYPVFTVVMVIYHYVERIWRIIITPISLYNTYDHE